MAIYPQGFKSHFLFNTAIINLLNEAGHEVAFITPFDTSAERGNFFINNSTSVNFKSRVATAAQIKAIGTQNRGGFAAISRMKTLYEWTSSEEVLCHDIMELDEIKV